jgi:hypothetical protein
LTRRSACAHGGVGLKPIARRAPPPLPHFFPRAKRAVDDVRRDEDVGWEVAFRDRNRSAQAQPAQAAAAGNGKFFPVRAHVRTAPNVQAEIARRVDLVYLLGCDRAHDELEFACGDARYQRLLTEGDPVREAIARLEARDRQAPVTKVRGHWRGRHAEGVEVFDLPVLDGEASPIRLLDGEAVEQDLAESFDERAADLAELGHAARIADEHAHVGGPLDPAVALEGVADRNALDLRRQL